jgi:hypothetical protein
MNKSSLMFKNALTVTVFFSLLLMFSCSSSNVTRSTPVEPVPDGFNNPDMVLIIQKKTKGIGHNRKNNIINDSFKKYYSGKYEMLSSDDIGANLKYKDKLIYRYIFHHEVIYASPGMAINYRIDYLLYDRATGKQVNLNVDCSMPAEAPDAIAKKLNKYLSESKTGTVSSY